MFDGWSPINYPTEEACLERVEYAEKLHQRILIQNPGVYDKQFKCVSNQIKIK